MNMGPVDGTLNNKEQNWESLTEPQLYMLLLLDHETPIWETRRAFLALHRYLDKIRAICQPPKRPPQIDGVAFVL